MSISLSYNLRVDQCSVQAMPFQVGVWLHHNLCEIWNLFALWLVSSQLLKFLILRIASLNLNGLFLFVFLRNIAIKFMLVELSASRAVTSFSSYCCVFKLVFRHYRLKERNQMIIANMGCFHPHWSFFFDINNLERFSGNAKSHGSIPRGKIFWELGWIEKAIPSIYFPYFLEMSEQYLNCNRIT